MRIYISGPISGNKTFRQEFADAEKKLSWEGNYVVNPAKLEAVLPMGLHWDEYMRVDLEMLKLCNAIYMLKGWQKSKGARIEHEAAVNRNMKIVYQEEETDDTIRNRFLEPEVL